MEEKRRIAHRPGGKSVSQPRRKNHQRRQARLGQFKIICQSLDHACILLNVSRLITEEAASISAPTATCAVAFAILGRCQVYRPKPIWTTRRLPKSLAGIISQSSEAAVLRMRFSRRTI